MSTNTITANAPTYVDPVLNDILYQINYSVTGWGVMTGWTVAGNDLSLLSAIPYLPVVTSGDPFSSTSQQQAVNSILSSFALATNETALYSIAGTSSNPTASGIKAPGQVAILNTMAQIILNGTNGTYTYAFSPQFAYVPLMKDSTTNSQETNQNASALSLANQVNASALSLANLGEAFYQAGSAMFLQFLCDRINQSANLSSAYGITTGDVTPASPVNPTLSSASAPSLSSPTFQDVVDLTRYTIAMALSVKVDASLVSNRLLQLNLTPASFQTWAASASKKVKSSSESLDLSSINTLATDSLNYVLGVLGLTNASIVNNPETVQALLTFGLGPWLVMAFITSFQNAGTSFVTQAYSRIAIYYVAMVALSNMASMGGKYATPLYEVVNVIQNQISNSVNNIDNSGPIADVLQLSMQNSTDASTLALQNQSLQNRVGIASDLQTTYQYEKKRTQRAKSTFYAWLVAFIIVLVVSVILIMTDRIAVFLPFAFGTLLLILVVLILSWAMTWLRRSSTSDDDN